MKKAKHKFTKKIDFFFFYPPTFLNDRDIKELWNVSLKVTTPFLNIKTIWGKGPGGGEGKSDEGIWAKPFKSSSSMG